MIAEFESTSVMPVTVPDHQEHDHEHQDDRRLENLAYAEQFGEQPIEASTASNAAAITTAYISDQ
jgi:hypothetical protein